VRQSYIHEGVSLNYHEMHRRIQDHAVYQAQALPAKVAQGVLRLFDKNWQSFFQALLAWQADPSKFLGRPKLPGYQDRLSRPAIKISSRGAICWFTTPFRRSASQRSGRA
jgi:putative transposase